MAEATGSAPAPLHRSIPDEIAVWEILVRLPPKDVLRCRAVCPAWRSATSARDFLLAHHARQPTLPLVYGREYVGGKSCQNIITFDHQAAAAAQPTLPIVNHHNSAVDDGDHQAGQAPVDQLKPVTRPPGGSGSNLIMVFDTTTELFSQMHAPDVPGYADLFEMGDMIGMASFNTAKTVIDIWVMQDYESQVWAFKCRIQLPIEELQRVNYHNVVVMPGDGELLLLVETEDWLHHVDINGKLVASFHSTGLSPTLLRLKQTLVQHTFFPTLEGYVVNDSPFI